MNIFIEPANFKKEVFADTNIVSFSVDCDLLSHYINFAPLGTTVEDETSLNMEMFYELLNILEQNKIKATFFCIANQLNNKDYTDFYKKVISLGHKIGNHTFSHPEMDILTEEEYLKELIDAHNKIRDILGIEAIGYRAPAYYVTRYALDKISKLGYRYDTSICYSRIRGLLLDAYSIFNCHYRMKKHSDLHNIIKKSKPFVFKFEDGRRLLEWPIPNACGLSYYGTLHCSLPKIVFYTQTFMLNLFLNHIHYEIHPIELMTEKISKSYPWLKSMPFAYRNDSSQWMNKRLKSISLNKRIVTLEEISV